MYLTVTASMLNQYIAYAINSGFTIIIDHKVRDYGHNSYENYSKSIFKKKEDKSKFR